MIKLRKYGLRWIKKPVGAHSCTRDYKRYIREIWGLLVVEIFGQGMYMKGRT